MPSLRARLAALTDAELTLWQAAILCLLVIALVLCAYRLGWDTASSIQQSATVCIGEEASVR